MALFYSIFPGLVHGIIELPLVWRSAARSQYHFGVSVPRARRHEERQFSPLWPLLVKPLKELSKGPIGAVNPVSVAI